MGVEVITFGCRLNMVESESMRRNALAAGHEDLIIINTCAVTAEASRQARQAIRRLGREQPDKRIVVTGCGAQTEPESFASLTEVSQVIGNADKTSLKTWEMMARALSPQSNDAAKNRVEPIEDARHMATHQATALIGHTRGFIAVQNGCDHRCTFCIIPFGRGPSRSLGMGAVVEQIKALVNLGQKEVVLTGVDLTSYGSDLPGSPKLGTLVQAIFRHVPDLPRLRLSSIDSIEADEALIDAIAGEKRLMPHLHLSLQAGDDLILKRMKRRHSRADSVEFCATIRKARPDISFSADLIAGFPTETEAMFANTLALIEDCGLSFVHVFPFSPRAGTPAAKMPPVSGSEIKSRAARLRQAADVSFLRHLQAQEGKTLRVLSERGGIGRTEDFTPVVLGDIEPNLLLDVKISGHNGKALLAHL
eukprot:gene16676-16856_t